jgi:hypothetical protein
MATIEELSAALVKADAAGNAADAKAFANEIRRVRQTFTSAPVSEIPQDRGFAGVAGDVLAGAVRGAGSIGATILGATVDPAARAFGIQNDFIGRQDRREAMTQGLQTMGADPESTSFAIGKTGAEIAGTLPIGGFLGKGVAAVAPRAAPLATALQTGGFSTGAMTAAQRAAAGLAPATAFQSAGNLATRAGGGAVTGAVSSAAVNPEDATSGALIGAVLPTVGAALVKQGAKFSGWLYDAMKSKLGEVKAGEIARRVAGGDLAAIRATNAAAQQGLSSGQAAAGIDNAAYAALDGLARKQNPASYYSRQETAQEADATNKLARLAGGATATESRAVRNESKNALNAITAPMRETELGAAGIAGELLPGLEAKAARFGEAATGKVEDVRRFTAAVDRADEWSKTWAPSAMGGDVRSLGIPRYPAAGTFPGQLAVKADQVATDAAESSLRFGEVARDAKSALASLGANGLKPLKTESLLSTLQSKLANPDIGTNRDAAGAITRVSQMLQDWTNKYGVITPEALYAIRKNGVAGAIADLNPGATEDQRRKFAQSVMGYVRPLFDDAIEQAGGTGWRNYLKTFEQGMHGIEEKKMADVARKLYESGDKQAYINLVTGRNPKLVEDTFGAGKYDFVKEMGQSAIQFEKIADAAARDINLKKQAAQGGEELSNIIQDATARFNFPPSLSTKIAIARQGLREFEGKVNKATLAALTEGMKSGASANAMLDTLPAKERVKVLRIMTNSSIWNPAVGVAARQSMVNALAPNEQSQNQLAPQ